MKKFLFLSLFFLTIFFLINTYILKKSQFSYKENIKKIFFYAKKNYLINKYSGCFIEKKNKQIDKKIIIAGHSYGAPSDNKNLTTYPKFLKYLSENYTTKFSYIFLAGDIVKEPSKKNFNKVRKEINEFTKNLYVAPGNHDVGLGSKNNNYREEFISEFGKTYQKIIVDNNLFFVLDTNFHPGNISSDQIDFLKKEVANIKNIKNIFVITHHLIWQNYTNGKIKSNINEDFFFKNNFHDVLDLFNKIENKTKIFFISGDVGVFAKRTVIFCEQKKNIYFIATGMGNKYLDNYLKILISSNGEILSLMPIFF